MYKEPYVVQPMHVLITKLVSKVLPRNLQLLWLTSRQLLKT